MTARCGTVHAHEPHLVGASFDAGVGALSAFTCPGASGPVDSPAVHLAHHRDGYPLCWPQDCDGDFTGSREAAEVTCSACLSILHEDDTPRTHPTNGDTMTTSQTTHTWRIVTKKDGRDDPCTIVDSEGRNLVDTYGWEHTPVIRNRALAEKVLAALNADEDTVRVPRRIAQYAAAYIGEADHQEALDVATAIESALDGTR